MKRPALSLAVLAALTLSRPALAVPTLQLEGACQSALEGATVQYARKDYRSGTWSEWKSLPQPLQTAATPVPDLEMGARYKFRLHRDWFFRSYTWEGEVGNVQRDTTIRVQSDTPLPVEWNLLALVLPPVAVGLVAGGILLPRARRSRHDALIALDKAKQAEAEALAATLQAFEMAKIPLPPDYRVPGYRIIDLLGEGGMASVYRVQSDSGDLFALKVPHAECLKDAENLSRFHREIEISRAVQHAGLLRVYDVGAYATEKFPEVPYLVMEIVKGRSLDDVMAQQTPLPIGQAVRWVRTILDALGAAHAKGIVHRDIKPHNVMLTDRGDIKLMDFGIARASDSSKLTATGTALGTPAYMAPEQFGDSRTVDARADIYATGVLLFEMLTGALPFDDPDVFALIMKHMNDDPPSPRSLRADIPEGLAALVLRMLAKSPGDRPHSAIEVASQLAAFVDA